MYRMCRWQRWGRRTSSAIPIFLKGTVACRWFFSLSSPFWFGKKVSRVFAFLHFCIWLILKGQCHEIFDFWFFHESVSPQPLSIPLESFRIFLKIRGYIRSSRCITSVVDIGGKFATCVVDTSGAPWLANISANLRKKFETVLMGYSGAGGKLIHENNRSKKSRDTVPLSTFRVFCILRAIWPKRSYLHVREY